MIYDTRLSNLLFFSNVQCQRGQSVARGQVRPSIYVAACLYLLDHWRWCEPTLQSVVFLDLTVFVYSTDRHYYATSLIADVARVLFGGAS